MQIRLASPRGFCAGVDRAIEIVNRALDILGSPIYVRHEVVHNKFVVDSLKDRGAIFVDELDEVPDGKVVIFSAHGVSKAVEDEAKNRNLKVFDASCPLVKKVHFEVIRLAREGRECILIGHHGHPEVVGTMGQYDDTRGGYLSLVENIQDVYELKVKNPLQLSYVTQTTLSKDDTEKVICALKERFPRIKGPRKDDICYATQNRQDAVRLLANECDLVLVVGSVNSSNSNRLRELAERIGTEAHLIDNATHIENTWLEGKEVVGITAGASAPDILVVQVIDHLQRLGGSAVRELEGKAENIVFSIPKELRLKTIETG
ncbi:MAG: 4-hydroxy-3-methylbut-2-enyl diphosphate reductase [Candidatus Endonucleobacter sp. (ex Gigantidas childressi)]|nr:4-hydroxy-3-methylbut-2-enyl diphosphate reductase [Candidatus Endonucleobacter sp. (ex Gigantidas childressi)]